MSLSLLALLPPLKINMKIDMAFQPIARTIYAPALSRASTFLITVRVRTRTSRTSLSLEMAVWCA